MTTVTPPLPRARVDLRSRADVRRRPPAPPPASVDPSARFIRRPGRPGRRIFALHVVVLVLTIFVAYRLVDVQVLDRERYQTFGEGQRLRTSVVPAGRGTIYDRDGDVLAVSHDQPTVYADPHLVADPAGTAAALAGVLDVDVGELTEAVSDSDRRFVYVQRLVTDEQAERIEALDLEGIGIVAEPVRARPAGELGRSLLGSVNDHHEALGGLELFHDDVLAGQAGQLRVERNDQGLPIPGGRTELTPPTPGRDLVLTIDQETQWFAESLVMDQVAATRSDGGFAVVMETKTGELLAVASADAGGGGAPAELSSGNRAFHDSYEPGSVSKLFTLAAALEEGTIGAEQVLHVPLFYTFSDKIFREPYAPGDQDLTITQILAESSNIGTIRVAETIGTETLHSYLDALGFGRRVGPDGAEIFPGEQPGSLRPVDDWRGTTLATVAFGQGISVTGVQLAAAYNTIANDGRYVPPVLVESARNADGHLEAFPAADSRRVFSEETAVAVSGMLETVVTDGTGKQAAVDGYRVAGKTGTAQKVDADTGEYSASAHVATFAGFVPADDPELTIVVVLDHPRTNHLAGNVAAPLFSELARHTLQTLRVPPSAPEPELAAG